MEKHEYPYWIRKIEDENLREAVTEIFKAAGQVRYRQGRYKMTQSDGDEADLEAAREELRDKLLEIYIKGTPEKNPLWAAIMMIRPQVIGRYLDPQYTTAIADALWAIKNSADGNEVKATFFGRLGARLNGKQITFYRAVVSGDVIGERKEGKYAMHYFPGIPRSIRQEAGVKLSTHPTNADAVKKAYGLMIQKAEGPAKEAIEAHLRDIEYLYNLMQKK